LALAREFARNGYDLLLVARKEEALKEAATEIEHESGVAVRIYAIDLARMGAPEELFHYVQEAGVHVDVLINNAGLGAHGPEVHHSVDVAAPPSQEPSRRTCNGRRDHVVDGAPKTVLHRLRLVEVERRPIET
jgi:NAD(P)-dependent dehydrogenase (short-subunit alcohol dehydrogenase family)